MRVKIPIMIQDPELSAYEGMPGEEDVIVEDDFFLDGPITRKVAVIDFDPETGALAGLATFRPPSGRGPGGYDVADPGAFQQVSLFGTVMRTIAMFERKHNLGRAVRWAFPGEQLLVVPRAGEWANAYYERASHSLQFFSFSHRGSRIHTSLSRDIVTHETGHAVLDAVVPDLYHSITPQSLALHEAIADLTAVVMAFESRKLRDTVLAQTKGSIAHSTAFNTIAEEFGAALHDGRPLRDLNNDAGLRSGGGIVEVPANEPHALSQVMSGALYRVMLGLHHALTARYRRDSGALAAASRALGIGARRFARFVFRALDYLPPGEVSFADYGRAILSADQASHPDSPAERDALVEEFVRRGIVADPARLDVEVNREARAFKAVDRRRLITSDWAAHEFVNDHRSLFGVPDGVAFELRPRLDSTKAYFHRDGERTVRELIFKVSWQVSEPAGLGSRFPRQRDLTMGSTLAIDWDQPLLRARLVNRPSAEQRDARDRFLRRLLDDEMLIPGPRPDPTVPGSLPPRHGAAYIETAADHMRVTGSAATLHIAGRFAPELADS